MGKIPILFLSDSPNSPTGLGRITREIMLRGSKHLGETFKFGSYGLGGVMSTKLPWPQFQITSLSNWAPPDLPKIWEDFSEGQRGIVMTIWNPSSLQWLVEPEKYAPVGTLRDFLKTKPFDVWGYFPIDAEGPNGRLPIEVKDVISKFGRRLFYTRWAADLYDKDFPAERGIHSDHLPHGTDTSAFYPQDRAQSRKRFVQTVLGTEKAMPLRDEVFMVGIVATNSQRKNWGLGFKVCQELLNRGVNVGLWAHTNAPKRTWDLAALEKEFGMKDRVILTTTDLSDEKMAEAYSALDVVLGIGDGEGWGLTHTEALACGVPVIHGGYAGGAEYLPAEYKVKPLGFYAEGLYANERPVFDPKDWADKVQAVAGTRAVLPDGLSWKECWPWWQKWFIEGANG